jgi:hypothetical protein
MTNLTAEEARRLSRIVPSVPSVPIGLYVAIVDNAILEATKKGHFEIALHKQLVEMDLSDDQIQAIVSHYESKGFEFRKEFVRRSNGSYWDLFISWESTEPAESTESNDATSDREALVEYLGGIKNND